MKKRVMVIMGVGNAETRYSESLIRAFEHIPDLTITTCPQPTGIPTLPVDVRKIIFTKPKHWSQPPNRTKKRANERKKKKKKRRL